jgi:hypothetical protein
MENPDVKNTCVQTLPIWMSKARAIRIRPIFELAKTIFFNSFRFFQMRYPLISGIRKPWE